MQSAVMWTALSLWRKMWSGWPKKSNPRRRKISWIFCNDNCQKISCRISRKILPRLCSLRESMIRPAPTFRIWWIKFIQNFPICWPSWTRESHWSREKMKSKSKKRRKKLSKRSGKRKESRKNWSQWSIARRWMILRLWPKRCAPQKETWLKK